jgi:hypothetical protein
MTRETRWPTDTHRNAGTQYNNGGNENPHK